MHFLSLPFGSACNFLVSPFFYKVCTSMLVRYNSELVVRVILNDHFTKKKEDFFLLFPSLYSQTLFETNLFSGE